MGTDARTSSLHCASEKDQLCGEAVWLPGGGTGVHENELKYPNNGMQNDSGERGNGRWDSLMNTVRSWRLPRGV